MHRYNRIDINIIIQPDCIFNLFLNFCSNHTGNGECQLYIPMNILNHSTFLSCIYLKEIECETCKNSLSSWTTVSIVFINTCSLACKERTKRHRFFDNLFLFISEFYEIHLQCMKIPMSVLYCMGTCRLNHIPLFFNSSMNTSIAFVR